MSPAPLGLLPALLFGSTFIFQNLEGRYQEEVVSERMSLSLARWRSFYDISVPLGEVAAYGGDLPFAMQVVCKAEESGYALSNLSFCAHAGTHLDAPAHLMPEGKTLDQYQAERFILPAQVVEVRERECIPQESLLEVDAGREDYALLFKTQNSRQGLLKKKEFCRKFVYLSAEAARMAAQMGVRMVGIDSLSVDSYDDLSLQAHRILLEHDVLILEGIDLGGVPPGRYTLICLPLLIAGGEAAPARAVLLG
jgi:arylformamidase